VGSLPDSMHHRSYLLRIFAARAWAGVCLFVLMFTLLAGAARAQKNSGGETVVTIQTLGGLRFDPPRFVVAPGAKVRVNLENADDMAHNFVITKPDARVDVVNAAMTIVVTPDADFIPKTDKILEHSIVMTPGKKTSLTFTAPAAEGVYPYVCTYPGHGLVMYGAMYVRSNVKETLPPIAKDMNLPEMLRMQEGQLHAYQQVPPYVCRIFMRDCGPAAIAVALPNAQNYCWDAGACRLRYAWTGAFIDPMPHWTGNGDGLAEVLGRIYYRAPGGMQLHIGKADHEPAVKFLGYRLVERFPEFHYTLDGVDVRELIKPQHHGGLETTFTLGGVTQPVTYSIDPQGAAAFASSAGKFENGLLTLSPAQAKSFTISLTEVPGREPMRYWSMNDTPKGRHGANNDVGVRGRAVSFDGAKQQLETGVTTDELTKGGTIAMWVKARAAKSSKPKKGEAAAAAAVPERKAQAVAGGSDGANEFALGWSLDDATGYEAIVKAGTKQVKVASGVSMDGEWHHLAMTSGGGEVTLYVDGKPAGKAAGTLPPGLAIFLGSAGGAQYASAVLDEVRIDDRAYSADEVAALYRRERAQDSKTATP